MKKSFYAAIALSALMLMTTSCASILNGKYQKVTVKTPSADSKVYVNNELQGTGKVVVAKMKRDRSVKQVKVEREGFKPDYVAHYQDRKSGLYILSWVPFGVLFLMPPQMDFGPKAYNYPKELVVGKDMLELQKRDENEKYVYLKNTAFDVKKEDIKLNSIKRKNFKKKKDKYKKHNVEFEDMKFDNSIFSDEVTEVLKNNNYLDTTNTIFRSHTNSMYISAKITKLEFDNVWEAEAKTIMNFFVSKLEIEWEIFDLYNQPKYKQTFKAESGEFARDFYKGDVLKASMEDAVTESFFKFMATKEVRKLIEQKEAKEVKQELLKITKPLAISTLEDAMESTVTIKVKEGHGSGCFVTTDGYIITNFHVVASSDKITVVTKDGKEYPAKIIRKSEGSDLALIKIEGTTKHAFTLPAAKNYKIGEDIFAIGTPKSVELGQSLSKGIISGFRTFEKNNLIQTDASVNGGNSGGALVNKDGQFIGVVNAKVFGVGVEGLGFSIPAETIFTDLSISY